MNLSEIKDAKLRLRLIAADKAQNHRIPHVAKQEPNSINESVAAPQGGGDNQVRCHVCVTSFRVRLLDARNIWDANAIDALVEFGLLHDDSPAWAEVEVSQECVATKDLERTEIEITILDPAAKIPDTSGD